MIAPPASAMRVIIVTSAHPVFDKRVFQRHAVLLAHAGYDVHLVAPHDEARVEVDGVVIHGFPRPLSKGQRLRQLPAVYRLAASLRGDVYHLHDPDLLAIGWRLQRLGAAVVYDAHEDFSVERSMLGLPAGLMKLLSGSIGRLESRLARRLDAVVCPHRIRLEELKHPDKPGLFLPNYPPRDVFGAPDVPARRDRSVVYSGLLSAKRGAQLILDAAQRMPDVTFLLLAKFMDATEDAWFRQELAQRRLANVDFRGFVPFAEMPAQLARAGVGIMPWRRTAQHLRAAQPSKLYEYMACSLPVLASDLPITREIVESNQCGRLHADDDVAGFVTEAYALLDDAVTASEMGARGRTAFERYYSYESAGAELMAMYERLRGGGRSAPQEASHA
jgi:glycosyltransferase involved in cell wall biosynthesis